VEPGAKVEVRSNFDRSWARGFEVAEVIEENGETAYRIRRRSDGQILPVTFKEDDLREERRSRGMWWY